MRQEDFKMNEQDQIEKAIELIGDYGGIDGGHHKQWLIDQVLRVLTDTGYKEWVTLFECGEDGPNTYEWDVGAAP